MILGLILGKLAEKAFGIAKNSSILLRNFVVHSVRRVTFIIGLIFQLGPNTNIMLVSTTGLLIVVGVVRDTFFNINAELKLHGYDETLLVR